MFSSLKKIILEQKEELVEILSETESKSVAFQEIELSINALNGNNKYVEKKVESIASYLPMNLPLYSLITYTIIPKLCSNVSYYKPSAISLEVSKKIHKLLNLNEYNIHLFEGTRADYNEVIAKRSNVVIFVGKYENSFEILKKLSKQTLFICFGVGQNPAIVADGADLNIASKKIAEAIMFNYGQDCAKPNVILCKKDLYLEFEKKLLINISDLIEEKTSIKKLKSFEEAVKLLIKDKDFLVQGGNIDIKNMTLDPTIITKDYLDLETNYEEYYAPIFRILLYESELDLKKYFSNKKYKEENMAISLFGESSFIEKLPSSLILKDEIVSELDNGINEYGGYGKKTTYLSYKGINISKPLLINREINYFYNNYNFNFYDSIKFEKKLRNLIIKECSSNIKKIFGDNLELTFIFGSYAKNKENSTSDVDLFMGLKTFDEEAINKFKEWYFEFHYMYGKFPDILYPGEILTIDKLKKIMNNSTNIIINEYNDSNTFDNIFYTQIFTDKKIIIFGEENKIKEYERSFKKNTPKICEKIFCFLEEKNLFEDERDYAKALIALANNDLLYFGKKLKYENPKQDYSSIVNNLDDGLLKKYVYKK